MNIQFKGSPNYDKNRKAIDRIVIHWFGKGNLESAHSTFQKAKGTSAHYGVSGKTIWQWVKEEHVAYHAGNYAMNQRSIGIEHDATTDHDLSDESYETSGELIADICKRYSIPLDREHIIGHKEVRATQCPGTIDIDRLLDIAGAKMNGMPPYVNSVLKENLGIDVDANEGDFRGQVGTVKDKVNQYDSNQTRIKELENSLAKAEGEAAENETRLSTCERYREEDKEAIAQKGREVNQIQKELDDVNRKLQRYDGMVHITAEEYQRLQNTKVLDRYTGFQLFWESIKRLFRR